MKTILRTITIMTLCLPSIVSAEGSHEDYARYCEEKGGRVTPMTAWYDTARGPVEGWSKSFCKFERDHGLILIGLSTFSSAQSNIAATYMKNLSEIEEGSPLFQGGAGNPSYYVCKNLGGTTISYKFRGSFQPTEGGESDICVFGDGSMVSAWSLIYMANHRAGYDEVKKSAHSEPLPLDQ